MKALYYKNIIILGIALLFVSSCSEDLMDTINENPNNPTDVPVNLLLPVIQTNLAYSIVGGDMSLYLSVLTQHTTGVHAQMHQADRLLLSTNTFNNDWNAIYLSVMTNNNIMIDKAIAAESWHYAGVGQVIKTYTMSIATDMWGDVPFSEANKGSETRKPKYDTQEEIYTGTNGLLALVDEAIANLKKQSVGTPAKDDLIYGGNMALWIKAANALKAKLLTRLSNTSAYNADAVLTAVAASFSENSESFSFNKFSTAAATSEHPWFQEKNDRKHFAVSESFFDLLNENNDPRMDIFFDEGSESVPAPNGSAFLDQGGSFYTKMYDYIKANSPLPLITFAELKLMQAEAYLRKDMTEEANDAFEEAVKAALVREGIPTAKINSYIAQSEVFPGEDNLTLQDIWRQKYIALYPFQSVEAYAEWRRTDYPALVNPNGNIPLRLPYVQDEIDSNGENVPQVQPVTPVWWDK